jgi:N-acetylmuramoyl-L-alanine amidase
MMPLRFISEAMGAAVTWNGANQTVGLQFEGKTHTLTIGRKTGEIDIAPMIIADRTMAPLRYVGNLLDVEVIWNAANSTVTLRK